MCVYIYNCINYKTNSPSDLQTDLAKIHQLYMHVFLNEKYVFPFVGTLLAIPT